MQWLSTISTFVRGCRNCCWEDITVRENSFYLEICMYEAYLRFLVKESANEELLCPGSNSTSSLLHRDTQLTSSILKFTQKELQWSWVNFQIRFQFVPFVSNSSVFSFKRCQNLCVLYFVQKMEWCVRDKLYGAWVWVHQLFCQISSGNAAVLVNSLVQSKVLMACFTWSRYTKENR